MSDAEAKASYVDAHHHFWNPSRIPQTWMTADHAAIDRAFEAEDLAPLLAGLGITHTVLVQGAASDADTDYLLELAAVTPWVGAVTAWLRLGDADLVRRRLSALHAHPKFRAVRHLVHEESDPHWILRSEQQTALSLLEEQAVLLELPAVFPRHLSDVPELARRYPALTIVIDHLAKPPLGTPDMRQWEEELARAAAHDNVVAKVSGLNTMVMRPNWTSADLEPAVRAAVSCFGPSRLLFGSDWPVALLNGTYVDVVERTVDVIRSVAGNDAEPILGDNAARLYRFS
jgi:L-fuconolactonase